MAVLLDDLLAHVCVRDILLLCRILGLVLLRAKDAVRAVAVVVHVEQDAVDDLAGEVVAELWGPVVVNPSSHLWLGAEVCSNNTGELTALAELGLAQQQQMFEHSGQQMRQTTQELVSQSVGSVRQ